MPRFPREDPKGGLGAVTSTVIHGRLGGRLFRVHLVGVTLQVVARPWGGGKRRAGCRGGSWLQTAKKQSRLWADPVLGAAVKG